MAYTSKQSARNNQAAEESAVKQATAQQTASAFSDQRASTSMQLKQQQMMNASDTIPLQRVEDEELLQGKFETTQLVEEEEPLQGKLATAQLMEEEEPLQGKFATTQLMEEEEPLQGKFETAQLAEEEELLQGKFSSPTTAQLEEKPNNTGLPNQLKSGIESLSGMSMDGVKVHYNSDKPAQLNAHAYAQGTDIHVAPGQEQHLPHEAWHVVQQAQGRVKPTMQMKAGVPVNDDVGLETEADVMGAKAANGVVQESNSKKELNKNDSGSFSTVQRAGHAEDICFIGNWLLKRADATEVAEYQGGQLPGIASNFHGPFNHWARVHSYLTTTLNVVPTIDQQNKMKEMHSTKSATQQFLLLQNATTGMINPVLRDLKLGKHTASGTDQDNRGTGTVAKAFKIFQHDVMDKYSGSREMGFRDEDAWKEDKFADNTAQINNLLNGATLTGRQQIFTNLSDMSNWLMQTHVVYIGMSILIVVGGPGGGVEGKAVAIDFEHPIRDTEESFTKHRDGMLIGIQNMLKIVARYGL